MTSVGVVGSLPLFSHGWKKNNLYNKIVKILQGCQRPSQKPSKVHRIASFKIAHGYCEHSYLLPYTKEHLYNNRLSLETELVNPMPYQDIKIFPFFIGDLVFILT